MMYEYYFCESDDAEMELNEHIYLLTKSSKKEKNVDKKSHFDA